MQGIGRMLRDEGGAATIPFVVIFPFFIFMMILFTDCAVIYLTHSEMYNVARDAVRRMSTGQLTSEDEVTAYAAEHLHLGGRRYVVHSGFSGEMRIAIVVPVRQAAVFGLDFMLNPIMGDSLIATAVMRREPGV